MFSVKFNHFVDNLKLRLEVKRIDICSTKHRMVNVRGKDGDTKHYKQ